MKEQSDLVGCNLLYLEILRNREPCGWHNPNLAFARAALPGLARHPLYRNTVRDAGLGSYLRRCAQAEHVAHSNTCKLIDVRLTSCVVLDWEAACADKAQQR
eukprot:6257026-Amphidinium_carterae.1